MPETPLLGQIMMFAGNFAPAGWALCNGQLLSIAQNTALFSILGTTYGGDGISTFALPDFRSRVPIGASGGANGLTPRVLGETGGEENVTLTQAENAPHSHLAQCYSQIGNSYDGAGNYWSADAGGNNEYGTDKVSNKFMSPASLSVVGGNQPHANIQPIAAITFCIALQGVFPSRN